MTLYDFTSNLFINLLQSYVFFFKFQIIIESETRRVSSYVNRRVHIKVVHVTFIQHGRPQQNDGSRRRVDGSSRVRTASE